MAAMFLISVILIFGTTFNSAIENDTVKVGSLIHETKVKAPPDLQSAASKKFQNTGEKISNGKKGHDKDFHDSYGTSDDSGFTDFDNFHVADGDNYGYEEKSGFGKKGGDGIKKAYRQSSSYGDDDGEFGSSGKPKYKEWHYEHRSGSPPKTYSYESDSEDTKHSPKYSMTPPTESEPRGRLVGPGYHSSEASKKSKSKNPKKKKEQLTAATEYENVELYSDVDPEEGAPVNEYDGEEPDPEYAAQYADADAYADVYY